jgi:hypothetical protein
MVCARGTSLPSETRASGALVVQRKGVTTGPSLVGARSPTSLPSETRASRPMSRYESLLA